jgi:uncharacterized protein YdhG (YjbR/CyaY superfamily)
MPSTAATVTEYLDELDPTCRAAVERLRTLVRAAVPDATETMHYRMPTYELSRPVCSIGVQKHHVALYLCEIKALERHRDAFGHLDCGKGCIRFRDLDDLPLDAVRDLLEDAADEVRGVG